METKGLSVYFLKSDEVDMYVLAASYDDAISAGRDLMETTKFSCIGLLFNMNIEKVDDYGVIWRVSVYDLFRCLQKQHGDCEKIDMSKGYFVLSELYKAQ